MANKQTRDKEFYLNSKDFKSEHRNRRLDFQKYLDKTGTLDKITGIFMDLYEYPAMNLPILEYVRKRLTDTNPDDEKIMKLRPKLEKAKLLRDHLERENQRLKKELNENEDSWIDEEEINSSN